jgi:hypothetical protein
MAGTAQGKRLKYDFGEKGINGVVPIDSILLNNVVCCEDMIKK